MLFLTIASQSTYGRKLIISKDTVVTYILEDNRKIAILLKQGEYDAAMCRQLKNLVHEQDTLIDNVKHTLYVLQLQVDSVKKSFAELEAQNKDLIKDVKKYMRRSSRWAKIGGASIGLNILLIGLLILI